MKIRPIAACAALALSAIVPAVQAATVNFTGWTWGQSNDVHATTSIPARPTYNGAAGGFSGTLSGIASPFAALNGSFDAYCVEMTETIALPYSYTNYGVMGASNYFTGVDASKATALGQLISYVFDSHLFDDSKTAAGYKDNLSSALQLAIWNIVYDTDTTLNSGAFSDTSAYADGTVHFLGANTLLANSAGHAISYDLYVLYSGEPMLDRSGNQDQLIWRAKPEQLKVPEPTSLALTFAALGACGFAARRRAAKA